MTADVNVTAKVARAANPGAFFPWSKPHERDHEMARAERALSVLSDPEVLAGIAAALRDLYRAHLADVILALFPGRTEVAAEAWDTCAAAISDGLGAADARVHNPYRTKENPMADYTPTPEQVEAFKRAWHEADAEGDTGNRTLRGLTAAGPLIAAEALRSHRRRVARFMPAGLVDRATVLADLDDYAARIARGEGS